MVPDPGRQLGCPGAAAGVCGRHQGASGPAAGGYPHVKADRCGRVATNGDEYG
ncbi:hypothetical protein ABH930_001132 [Kitasatospora sp. GAS204A]|nr:hypothetical protein [Kitasatospora sp. GAS204B]